MGSALHMLLGSQLGIECPVIRNVVTTQLRELCKQFQGAEITLHMFYKCMSMASPLSMLLAPSWRLLFGFVNLFVRIFCQLGRMSQWLGKTYVDPAGMYAGQVWGTEYVKSGQGVRKRSASAAHELS
eukprot:1160141-Pelagomonas_calceolata.AAC.16